MCNFVALKAEGLLKGRRIWFQWGGETILGHTIFERIYTNNIYD